MQNQQVLRKKYLVTNIKNCNLHFLRQTKCFKNLKKIKSLYLLKTDVFLTYYTPHFIYFVKLLWSKLSLTFFIYVFVNTNCYWLFYLSIVNCLIEKGLRLKPNWCTEVKHPYQVVKNKVKTSLFLKQVHSANVYSQ